MMPVSQTNDHNFLFVQIRMIQSNQWQGFDSPPELFALLNIKWRIKPHNLRERQRREHY